MYDIFYDVIKTIYEVKKQNRIYVTIVCEEGHINPLVVYCKYTYLIEMSTNLWQIIWLIISMYVKHSSGMLESQRVVLTMSSLVTPLFSNNENFSKFISLEMQKRLASNNTMLVKFYGHRLVWDLGMMVNLEKHTLPIQQAMQSVLPHWIYLKGIEIDGLVSPEQLVYGLGSETQAQNNDTIEWQFSDSEPYSMQMESVWRWGIENSHLYSQKQIRIALLDGGLPEFMMKEENKSFFFEALSQENFDFISNVALAGDEDGRDFNPIDPGDSGPNCPGHPNSWHGTKMAAAMHLKHDVVNGVHSAIPFGIIELQILRVLGQCSIGYANDVADAIVWASGGQINGLALKRHPAKIISMSFSGYGACPSYLQSAVNQALSLGVILISSAGNQGDDVLNYFPANCIGVLPIAASTRDGTIASYSNKGTLILNAAPGGNSFNPIITITVSASSELIPTIAIGSSFSAVFAATLVGLKLWLHENSTRILLPTRPFATTNGICNALPSKCGKGIINGKFLLEGNSMFRDDMVSSVLQANNSFSFFLPNVSKDDLDQIWPVNLTEYFRCRELEKQHMMSHKLAADTLKIDVSSTSCITSNVSCPLAFYYEFILDTCRPCNISAFSVLPGNASFLNKSSNFQYSVAFCPWICNDGFFQTLTKCLPGTIDCSDPTKQKPYTTIYSCAPNSQADPNTCVEGQYYGIPTAQIFTAKHYSTYLTSLILSTGMPHRQTPIISKQCSTYQYSYQSVKGLELDFFRPAFASQSGDHELSLIMDVTFHTLSMVNKSNNSIWFLAGSPHTLNVSTHPPRDGIGSNAQFGAFNWRGKGIGMAPDASMALVFDNGVIRRVDIATANITTLCGNMSQSGYVDGRGDSVLFHSVEDISISPDGTFALIADLVVIRYLNISTATVSLLVGKPLFYGSADGIGSNAVLFYPQSIAISHSGLFAIIGECAQPYWTFVARGGYPVIRRIDIPTARTTRLAGRWNQVGHVDGVGSLAFLFCPLAMTMASDDSYALFIDAPNNALRMIDLVTNAVSTLTKYYESSSITDSGISDQTPNTISNILGVGSALMKPFTCYKCPKGQYNNLNRTTSCMSCDAGSFASSIGLTTCTICSSVGVAAPNRGLSTCLACTPGTFQGVCSPIASHHQCTSGGCAFILGIHNIGPWNSVGMATIDPSATWIWSIPGAASNAPLETITFSRRLYLPPCHTCLSSSGGQAPIHIYMVVDDFATVFINDVMVINNQAAGTSGSGWNVGGPTTSVLNAGLNSIRIQARNTAGPAGLLLTIRCAITGSVLLRGDTSWCSTSNAGCMTQLDIPIQSISCTRCLPGTYESITRASSCLQCTPGTFSNNAGATSCQTCTSGTFTSISGASICQSCAIGQFAPITGASNCLNCTQCMPGTSITRNPCLQRSTANTVNCTCIPGFYGTGIGTQGCAPCPAYTNTTQGNTGGISLLDCKCNPGYVCNYTKTIHLTIRIPNMSVANFTSNYRTIFLAAVAKASNVSLNNVFINSVILSVGGGGLRRELSHSDIIVKFQVFETDNVKSNLLLDSVRVHLPLHIQWEHAHQVNIRRAFYQKNEDILF